MRSYLFLLLLITVGCADTVLDTDEGVIGTREQFLAFAGDRTVQNELTTITITRDGRITGVSDGVQIAGTWQWRDRYFCRTITRPVAVPEDCQLWERRDGLLIITRDRGAGEQLRFALPAAAA